MATTYFENTSTTFVLVTNSLVDDTGVVQTADFFLTDAAGDDHEIFFEHGYPSSLLPGSPRMFKSQIFPRQFKSKVYKRIFKP